MTNLSHLPGGALQRSGQRREGRVIGTQPGQGEGPAVTPDGVCDPAGLSYLPLSFGVSGLVGVWNLDATVGAAGFFAAFGFFGSRPLRFCPLAIVLASSGSTLDHDVTGPLRRAHHVSIGGTMSAHIVRPHIQSAGDAARPRPQLLQSDLLDASTRLREAA